jgi:hypothetical protein
MMKSQIYLIRLFLGKPHKKNQFQVKKDKRAHLVEHLQWAAADCLQLQSLLLLLQNQAVVAHLAGQPLLHLLQRANNLFGRNIIKSD